MPAQIRVARAWAAHAAAAWSFIFGCFHLVWATGLYIGLDPEFAARAFADPRFLAYDLLVALICFAAVPIAMGLTNARQWRLRGPTVVALAAIGTALLLLRSVGSAVQQLFLLANGRFQFQIMLIWELWFYVGAVLFTVSMWHYRNAQSSNTPSCR